MPLAATPQQWQRPTPAADEPPRTGRAWPAGSVGAIVILLPALIAGALAAYQLTDRSLWLDEGASVAIASQHGAALWAGIRHDGGNMLAYYLLLHVLIGWFGAAEVVIRLPSVIAGAATAGLTAALTLRLFERPRVAVSAGLLAAVSLPLVFWGQDARGYALMVAFATASVLAFVVIVQSPSPLPRFAAAAYVLTTLVALYIGYYAGLVVLAQLAVLPMFRHRIRLVIGCLAVVAAGCLPLILVALERGSGQLFWVGSPTWPNAGQAALALISVGLPPAFHITVLTIIAAVVTVAVLLAMLIRIGGRPRAGSSLIAVSWLLVPVVVLVAAALAHQPVELPRAIILAIPATAVLIAAGLHNNRVPVALAWAGLAVLLAMRGLVLAPTYGVSPENWKATAAYVARASPAAACVLFYPLDGRMPLDYYLRGSSAAARLTPVNPPLPWSAVRPYVERYAVPSSSGLDAIARRCPRLWVIASHQGHHPGTPTSERNVARYRRLLSDLRRRYPRPRRIRFGYAARIDVNRFWR